MNFSTRACLGLITLSSFCLFVACGDDVDVAPIAVGGSGHNEGGAGAGHGEAALECQVLGELCHAADSEPGPARDCHELGHVGNAEVCGEQFASCVGICTESEVIGAGGAGGASGADAHCVALGSLCHAAGDVDDAAQECHELGHTGNAAACAEGFDACATLCLAVLDELEHGAGGAGGAAAGGEAAGGAALGGAGGSLGGASSGGAGGAE